MTFGINKVKIYFCGYEKCISGHAFGPAIRPHYLIHFVLSGKGNFYIGKDCYNLTKGQAFLIKPGETTFYQADEEDPWEYAWLSFAGDESERMLWERGLGTDNYTCTFNNVDDIRFLLDKAANDFNLGRSNDTALKGYFYLVFSHIPLSNEDDIFGNQCYINKAKEYIINNFGYMISISDIAQYAGIDRTYLYKLFIENEGKSPKKYLTEHRLARASDMLKESDYQITEIALSCGFASASSFCHIFNLYKGCTPGAYRKKEFAGGIQ